MLTLAGAMISPAEQTLTLADWVVFAAICATANTFINIWPKARKVPLEKRTSFWAYRWSNIFNLGLPGAAIMIGGIIFVADTVIRH
jgi:hypothetical protein